MTVTATVVPLLSTRYLPFTDLPEHVAAMATISRWFDHASGDAATYDIAFGRSQYLLYHAAGALLTVATHDAILANRLLLVGIAVALPLSVRAALRALGRDEALSILACMPFLSRPLFVGFLPYIASFPLYFLGIALVVRRATETRRRRRSAVLLALLALALCYTHLSALVVFVTTAAALDVLFAARTASGPWSLLGWILTRSRSLAWLLPVSLLTAAWSLAGRITLRGESLLQPGEIGKMDLMRSIHALPLWAFDIFRSHLDEICGGVWWTSLAALAVLGARGRQSVSPTIPSAVEPEPRPFVLRLLARLDPAYAPLLSVLAIYFITPFRIGAGGMLNVRLAPLVAMTATLTVGRSRGALRTAALAVVALTTLVHAGNATFEIRALAREHMADFDNILAAMRPDTRLVTLAFDPRRNRTHFDPYPFAGSYHRARGGRVASYSFSDLPHWPVQFRSQERPPAKRIPLWIYAPCEYRHGIDGPYYDYVLVSGGVDPFAAHPTGPVFRETVRGSGFVLYEKVPGQSWVKSPEDSGGPCPP